MNIKNCVITTDEYTYKDITKPSKRMAMNVNGVSTLGTKAGGFGYFTPHFTVLSKQAVANIKGDCVSFCASKNLSKDDFLSLFPSLAEIIK